MTSVLSSYCVILNVLNGNSESYKLKYSALGGEKCILKNISQLQK